MIDSATDFAIYLYIEETRFDCNHAYGLHQKAAYPSG